MSNRNDEIEIDLLKLFKEMWRHALVIILVALLVASAVFAVTALFISPTYEATASFYVNNSPGQYLYLYPEIQDHAGGYHRKGAAPVYLGTARKDDQHQGCYRHRRL